MESDEGKKACGSWWPRAALCCIIAKCKLLLREGLQKENGSTQRAPRLRSAVSRRVQETKTHRTTRKVPNIITFFFYQEFN